MKPVDKKAESKKDKDFLGYPHYSESEDITNQEKRAELDVENLSRSHKNPADGVKEIAPEEPVADYSPEIVPGTEADVTIEDLKTLGPLDNDMDEGEDETLIPLIKVGPDLSGDDLDIPGAEENANDIGREDEENDFYSRGQN